jgi:hypothetical protein
MQVGIGERCEAREVQAALAAYFPGAPVCVYPSVEAIQERGPEGAFNGVLSANPSEFPVLLDVFPDPGEPRAVYRVQLRLARFLSERLSCRTICDGSEHGDSAAPYWSVVWDGGVPWLADDCGSVYADGEGGPVRLVRRLEIS